MKYFGKQKNYNYIQILKANTILFSMTDVIFLWEPHQFENYYKGKQNTL